MLFTETELCTLEQRKGGTAAAAANQRAVVGGRLALTITPPSLLQVKNVPLEVALKGDAAHSFKFSNLILG